MPSYSRTVPVPGKTAQELYDKVASEIDRVMNKGSLPIGKFDVHKDATAREVHLKSSMANATLICGDGHLKLDAQLSLFAAPFRGKIDETIDRWIAKAFATQT